MQHASGWVTSRTTRLFVPLQTFPAFPKSQAKHSSYALPTEPFRGSLFFPKWCHHHCTSPSLSSFSDYNGHKGNARCADCPLCGASYIMLTQGEHGVAGFPSDNRVSPRPEENYPVVVSQIAPLWVTDVHPGVRSGRMAAWDASVSSGTSPSTELQFHSSIPKRDTSARR